MGQTSAPMNEENLIFAGNRVLYLVQTVRWKALEGLTHLIYSKHPQYGTIAAATCVVLAFPVLLLKMKNNNYAISIRFFSAR